MFTPLHRLYDRVERVGRRVCGVVAILGLPVALTLAWASHNAATAEAERYAATVHRTAAITLEDAPDMMPTLSRAEPTVAATWTAIDQVVHRGRVEVPRGTEAGTRVTIWTDDGGEVSSAPRSQTQLVADAALVAVVVCLGVAAAAFAVVLLMRLAIGRLRSREWELAWEDFVRHHERPGAP
jgi:hypothetical protein